MPDVQTSKALAELHASRGELDTAIDHLLQALALKPGDAELVNRLGGLCLNAGREREALPHFELALQLNPADADLHANFATIAAEFDRAKAEAAFRAALAINPDQLGALVGLAGLLRDAGGLEEGERLARRAVELNPHSLEARVNLGALLTASGRADETIAAMSEAIRAIPRGELLMLQTLLTALNYSARPTPEDTLRAHQRFGAILPIRPAEPGQLPSDHDPERILRVGFLSPDFRAHSVAYFIEPLLRCRRRHEIETTCIFTASNPDATTKRLRALADHWIDAAALNDARLIDRVRDARLDILIELSGHTAGDRLFVMAARLAPIQITYCGYPNTTAVPAIDYRIVDSITDPPGAERFATEKLLRLDPCFLCYQPAPDAPAPAPRPAELVFGSFNAIQKLSPPVLDAWAAILQRVPNSRLLLKSGGLRDPSVAARIRRAFSDRDIPAERLDLVPWAPTPAEGLALYSRIAVALDTFPYNGTTTTCEALLMGAPVVTLRGSTHAGRVGASLLSAVGLPELIAESAEQYIDLAVALAADADRRADLHAELRDRLLDSPLCDGPAFARRFESALRSLWINFCGTPTAP